MTTLFIKKFCTIGFAIFFLGFVSLSCTSKTNDSQKVHLKYLMWGDPHEMAAVKKNLKAFEAKFPHIKVSIVHAQGGLAYTQKIQTLAAAEILPDVMYVDSWDFPEYVRKGLFLPLNRFFQREPEEWQADFFPELLKVFQYKGNLYGVPKDFTTLFVYYNRDLFDKAGLAYPESSWTWDDFLSAARALTLDEDGNGFIDQYGADLQLDVMRLAPWLWQNNGGLVKKDLSFGIAKSPLAKPNRETLLFLHQLIHQEKAATLPAQSRDQNLFETGRVAMVFGGRWLCLPYKKIKRFRWDIAPLPKRKKQATTLVTVCYAISQNSDHPKEAWQLVRFLTSPAAQKYVAGSGHAIPALKSVAQSPAFLDAAELPRTVNNQACLDSLSYARTLPLIPRWRQIESILRQEMSGYLSAPKANVDTALRRIQQQIDAVWPE